MEENTDFQQDSLQAPGPATDFCRVDQGSVIQQQWTGPLDMQGSGQQFIFCWDGKTSAGAFVIHRWSFVTLSFAFWAGRNTSCWSSLRGAGRDVRESRVVTSDFSRLFPTFSDLSCLLKFQDPMWWDMSRHVMFWGAHPPLGSTEAPQGPGHGTHGPVTSAQGLGWCPATSASTISWQWWTQGRVFESEYCKSLFSEYFLTLDWLDWMDWMDWNNIMADHEWMVRH